MGFDQHGICSKWKLSLLGSLIMCLKLKCASVHWREHTKFKCKLKQLLDEVRVDSVSSAIDS